MAEFGENLKKVREEKGITQQTLADHLYVTRQAISRWEGGSRYPDIMTAKKMAQFLEVSLDDLLSDDDMKLYVEKNAILDSSIAKRVQIILITLAAMCSFVISLIYLSNYFIYDLIRFSSESEMVKSILLTATLGFGCYAATKDKLNARIATVVCGIYLGTAVLTGIAGLIWHISFFTPMGLLGATALNLVFLVICIRFFCSKKIISPMPMYIGSGVYGIISIINFFTYFGLYGDDIPNEIFRDMFMLRLFSLIQALLLLGLLLFMAYTLNHKRKLVER